MAEIDLQGLQDEFGITVEPVEVVYDIPPEGQGPTPEQILQTNVVKANVILDRVIEEMANGNFSARMAEVAAKAVDSVTNIATTMGNLTNQYSDLQLKLDMIQYKKKLMENQGSKITQQIGQQNILVSNREDLLKMLRNGGPNKQIEDVKGEGDNDERNY